MDADTLNAAYGRIECELFENRLVRLLGARGRRVKCLSGTAWITACGERNDVFLGEGESWVVPNNGLVLAGAIVEGRICIDICVDTPRALPGFAMRPVLDAIPVLLRHIPRLQRKTKA